MIYETKPYSRATLPRADELQKLYEKADWEAKNADRDYDYSRRSLLGQALALLATVHDRDKIIAGLRAELAALARIAETDRDAQHSIPMHVAATLEQLDNLTSAGPGALTGTRGTAEEEPTDEDVDHAVAAMRHEFGLHDMVSEEDAVRIALRADRQRRRTSAGRASPSNDQ